MNPKALKHAASVIDEEILRLRNEVEECKSRAEKCLVQHDFFEKGSILSGVKKQLDACGIRLEEITVMLESLEQKKCTVDVLRSETVALLEKNQGEEDFSASSISPLA